MSISMEVLKEFACLPASEKTYSLACIRRLAFPMNLLPPEVSMTNGVASRAVPSGILNALTGVSNNGVSGGIIEIRIGSKVLVKPQLIAIRGWV